MEEGRKIGEEDQEVSTLKGFRRLIAFSAYDRNNTD
jgi:hypothetical protein